MVALLQDSIVLYTKSVSDITNGSNQYNEERDI